jgi:hypothetical protein
MLPFALASIGWIAAFGEGTTRHKLLRALTVFVPLFLFVGGWVARNDIVVGRPVLSSEAGSQFWTAHNPQTFSRYPTKSIDLSRDVAFAALTPAELQEFKSVAGHELATSDWFFERGVEYIRANPRATLLGAVRKVAAGFSWVFNPRRDAIVQTVYFLSYGPISILGIVGMILARNARRVHCLIYLQFLAFIAVTAIFWAHSGHRTYLDVYLIVFSVFAVEKIVAWVRQRRPSVYRAELNPSPS